MPISGPPPTPDPLQDPTSAIQAALAAGRRDEALALARGAVQAGSRLPPVLQVAARGELEAGRFDRAISLLRAWIGASPYDPAAWTALANAQYAARNPDLALQAADAALALAPTDPAALCAKAAVLQSLSRVDEAAGLLRQALVVDPHRPEARLGLALQAIERGDWDDAQAHTASLDVHPGLEANRLWLRARIALGRGAPAAALPDLDRLLAASGLGPEQQANAHLLRGEALDALGRPTAAFEAAVAGKSVQRRLYAERAASREAEADKLRRLEAWFEAADPAEWRTAAAPSANARCTAHAFLVGFPRSGTTLLEQVLAGHPAVESLEEAPTLADAYAEFLADDAGLRRLARLGDDEAEHWRTRYWTAVRAAGARPDGKLFLDKAPAGTLYLPLVAKLFPNAKVMLALRDPRDVVLSCLRNQFQMNAMTYAFTDLAAAADCYDACMGMAQAYRRVLPLDLIEVRHEALVEAFDAEQARIADFLGLEPDAAMADVAATAARRGVRTPSAPQLRAGLNRGGLGRWRVYTDQMAPVLPQLAPWIERFGYPEA